MGNPNKIEIPFPEAEVLHLRFAVGACRLRVTPGSGTDWVRGTYNDPANVIALRISQDGGTARIGQEFHWDDTSHLGTEPPQFEIELGKGRPYSLTIEGGASENIIDLGGLPLQELTVKYGAGHQLFDFSAANPQIMRKFQLTAGAAAVEMNHLANANCERLDVEGGAARFVLNFGGELLRDTDIRINAAMASVELSVPPSTAARVRSETVMGGLELGEGWMKHDGQFLNDGALQGAEPSLSVTAHVVMGALELNNSD